MSYQKLCNLAEKDWKDNQLIYSACKKVISKVTQGNPCDFAHLTFSSFDSFTDFSLCSEDVVRLAQYLSGDRIGLFKLGFEYITEEESFVLCVDNATYAVLENAIEHPRSGELIENVQDDVFVFFELNHDLAIELQSEQVLPFPLESDHE
ncbi:hypothetical protein [Enterovibrio norvegicus]|uniref:hypothetical protein n=1 Tax=Enterovibrio norvegicus TaxID=188144 RepID=UPI00352E5D2C